MRSRPSSARSRLTDFDPRYNISPGQTVHAVAAEDDRRLIGRYFWGFGAAHGAEDGHGTLAYNVRVETVANKPPFSGALQGRRCLVPADAWYAWRTIGRFKQPYLIRRADRAPMTFAAVWDDGSTVRMRPSARSRS